MYKIRNLYLKQHTDTFNKQFKLKVGSFRSIRKKRDYYNKIIPIFDFLIDAIVKNDQKYVTLISKQIVLTAQSYHIELHELYSDVVTFRNIIMKGVEKHIKVGKKEKLYEYIINKFDSILQKIVRSYITFKKESESKELLLERKNNKLLRKQVSRVKKKLEKKNKELVITKLKTKNSISELKYTNNELLKAEEEINKFNLYLEEKVRERTRELEKANIEWQRAHLEITQLLNQKTQFINQLAHDLRTPLMPILTLLKIVVKNEKDPQNKKDLEMALNNSAYLLELINDTLYLARLDSGTTVFKVKEIDIKEILENVIKINHVTFKEKKYKIKKIIARNLPKIMGDKLRISEVLENLVMNATHYTKPGGTLTFTAKKKKDYIIVGVKDNGVGIKKENMDKIFEEFYKLDPSRHEHSSGLGLSICKRILQKHNGKIWAESAGLGKGTSFYFTLPIKR